ncbi:MAG: PKD domain-containing protein, partial [Bacteroidota bacterium]
MKIVLRNAFASVKAILLLGVFFSLAGIQHSYAQVNANFSLSATSGCSPLSVTGTDLSTGTVNSWLWAFGNGNTSRVNSGVITTYTTPGTYTISLTVRDTLTGFTDTHTETITVFDDPTAGFTADVTSGCAPLDVTFTDGTTPGDGALTSWLWDFGDGNLGNTQNPTHTYASSGDYTVTLIVRDANGCQDSLVRNDYIAVTELATVDFSAPVQTGCAPPLLVDFTASVTPADPNYTYLWDFGDGTTSNQMNPSHFYSTNGSFTVSLTVTDPGGCQELVTKPNFVIIDQPVANFTALSTSVCAGSVVSFINNSTGADSYTWTFGDGNSSTDVNPNHTYAVPGTYSVSLLANNSAGCNDVVVQTNLITVNPAPSAAFSATNNIGCEIPLTVNFTDNSSADVIAWSWDLGNGVISPSQNPITTYSTPGFYDISLTVTNANGCQSTATIPNYVQLGAPDAEFIVGPTEGCMPLTVNFINTSTSPSDPIVSYAWDFGDGTISALPSPSHTYTAVGLYTVSLTVTTASGCQDQEIFAPIEVGERPNADFSASPRTACVNEQINFTDLTSGNVSDWYWDFGDGAGSNQPNPTHQYQDTGYFDVRLIVELNGCRDTIERQDYIHIQGPVAAFLMSPTAACDPPTTVSFFDNSINASTYLWDFGDGNTSTAANPTHTYNTVGNYTITLTIVDNVSGCTDQIQQDLPVTRPQAAFTGDLTTGCVDMTVNFNNGSIDASAYVWDFGDGNTSTAASPTHTYTSPGNYTVMLIASDGACSDTLIRNNYIEAIATNVDFSVDVSSGCAPLTVEFTDLSTPYPGASINNVTWLFGDGGTATGSPVTYVYNTGGSFDVTLRVEDSEGCVTELTRTGYVAPTLPEAEFSTTDTVACPGSRVDFTNQSQGSIISYQWDFGDGSPLASTPNPSHLYTTNGFYTVTLTVTDVNGCTDTESKVNFLNIGRPTASFVADNTVATCPPMTVNFTDQSSPDVVSWLWDFGDGSTSVLANPSKIYTIPGDYDVSLMVTNAQGCTDTLLMDDLIDLNGPTGAFTFTPNEGCRPHTVNFTATSPTPGWTYTWDFGDGTGGTGTTISHEYQTDTTINPIMFVEDDQGCSVLVTNPNSVVIRPLPEPSFISNITEVCLGQSVIFTNTSTSKRSITDFLWDFGDGNTSSAINPTHAYADTGVYDVYLRLTTVDGCIDTSSVPLTITVTNPPDAIFTAAPNVGCEPYFVTFTESSTGDYPLVDWAWSFGDGNLGSGQVIAPHQYTTAGNYTATLRVTDNRGCSNTVTQPITVNPLPPVEFSAFRYGCAPITVAFTDETIHPSTLVSWLWDFGDGNTSTVQDPNHTYTADGTYTVSLTATDINGCTYTTIKTDYIKLEHPQANFVSNAGITCPPQVVNFIDTSVPDTTITWRWDFGDGSPVSNAQNPTHTYYSSPDTFDVSLIVTNIFGCADTIVQPQHVITYEPPNASFTITDTSACVPQNIVVASTSTSNANGVAITGYFWDFGTGSGLNSPTASFLYSTAGTYSVSLEVTDANGCKDTASKVVYIHPNPEIDFIAGDTVGCAVTAISFTGVSTGVNAPVLWEWDFGDGKSGTGQNPTNTYFNDGTYSVSLRATDANGCRDSVTKINYIELDHPTADFSVSQLQTCPGTAVTFSDLSTGNFPMTSWIWDFGDGSPLSFAQNPTHTYTVGGTYTVSLVVSDGINCRDTLTRNTYIQVYDPPVAAFNVTPSQDCIPMNVAFSDVSTNGTASIVSWAWDFGDGGNSSVPNPSYSYATAGTYTVTLTVTDANGCQSTTTSSVEALQIPIVDFMADQPLGCAPQGITFSDLTVSPYVKTSYLWDFGDGTTSTSPGPFHQYNSDGVYTVKLIVEDQNGCRDSLTKNNYIRLSHPVSNFTWDATEVCPNVPVGVSFTDVSIPDTTIVAYVWDFGDGTTSTERNPSHSYSTPGNYSVSLRVINTLGCTDDTVQSNLIEVLNPPATDFSMTDSANCTPLTIQFGDLSVQGDTAISSWQWDFGNGDFSLSQNPVYTWNTSGVYTVSLTTRDLNGCETTDSVQVHAFNMPEADFTASQEVGCAPQSVSFTNTSTAPYTLTFFKWYFGDGDSAVNIENPVHVYPADGDYTVTLIVGDVNGCTDTLERTNFIRLSHPVADFSFDQSLVCPGIPVGVSFTDTSVPDTTLASWSWDFGDGTTSNLQNPSHSYSAGGTFTVSLIVENVLGCRDTLIRSSAIRVHDAPLTSFSLSDSTGCEPLSVDFTNTTTTVINPVVSWDWQFGDGSNSALNSPTHEFVNNGTYTVSLTATDNEGCTATYSKDVVVYENPVANFVASDSLSCAPVDITFISSSTGAAALAAWQWDFGDGNTSTAPVPVNTYAADGIYDVSLIVTDINGCSDTLDKPQYIRLSHPQADFSADLFEVCPGETIQFTDTSTPDTTLATWSWNFGDGSTSSVQNPSYSYS